MAGLKQQRQVILCVTFYWFNSFKHSPPSHIVVNMKVVE